jgi:signal peptidase I
MSVQQRKGWLAGLLSFLLPGLGQFYNGQGKKGLIFFAVLFLASPVSACVLKNGVGVPFLSALLLGVVAFKLFVIVDAVINARRIGEEFKPRRYNRWYVYLGLFALYVALSASVSLYVRNNVAQAFKVPASSMEPTLLIGDQFIADRTASARAPKRGDVIVFRYPEDEKKDFVKRVVAMGGDRVEIRDKVLFVNGKASVEKYAVHGEKDRIPRDVNPRDNFGPLTVPAGSYFVMGDNRDRSYDSRFWGCVDQEKIKGTVRSIYWSWNPKTGDIRWERIGRAVK